MISHLFVDFVLELCYIYFLTMNLEQEIHIAGASEKFNKRARNGKITPSEIYSLLQSDNRETHHDVLAYLEDSSVQVWPLVEEIADRNSGKTEVRFDESKHGVYGSAELIMGVGQCKSSVVFESDTQQAREKAGLTLLHHMYRVPRPISEEDRFNKNRLRKVVGQKFVGAEIVYESAADPALHPLMTGRVKVQTGDDELTEKLTSYSMRELRQNRLEQVAAGDLLRRIDELTYEGRPSQRIRKGGAELHGRQRNTEKLRKNVNCKRNVK
jgi:hypothetical protein